MVGVFGIVVWNVDGFNRDDESFAGCALEIQKKSNPHSLQHLLLPSESSIIWMNITLNLEHFRVPSNSTTAIACNTRDSHTPRRKVDKLLYHALTRYRGTHTAPTCS